jgi:hypothetical protein
LKSMLPAKITCREMLRQEWPDKQKSSLQAFSGTLLLKVYLSLSNYDWKDTGEFLVISWQWLKLLLQNLEVLAYKSSCMKWGSQNMCPVKNSSAAWVCVYYLGLISVRSFGLGMQSGQFITQERFKSCRLWKKLKNLRYPLLFISYCIIYKCEPSVLSIIINMERVFHVQLSGYFCSILEQFSAVQSWEPYEREPYQGQTSMHF